MLTDRCASCPRVGAGLPSCIGLICPAYCTTMREGLALYTEQILAWQPPPEEGVTHSAAPIWVVTRPSVAQSLSTLDRMKACPHRTNDTGCGCGGLACCALGKGRDGLVNHADCFACLQELGAGNGPPAE